VGYRTCDNSDVAWDLAERQTHTPTNPKESQSMIKQRKLFPRDVVAADLEERIARGEFAPGAQLPTQRDLASHYGFAERTVRDALQILAGKGLVITRERQGSHVALAQRSIAGPAERMRRSKAGGLFRPAEQVEMLRAELVTGDLPLDALSAFRQPQDAALGLREYVVRTADQTGQLHVATYGASYIHPDVWEQVPELREPEPIPDGIIGAIYRATERRCESTPSYHWADGATERDAEKLGIAEDSPVLIEITECVAGDGGIVEWNLSVHPRGYRIGS
jgi:DNA-binding GntR family transcriptional regulator